MSKARENSEIASRLRSVVGSLVSSDADSLETVTTFPSSNTSFIQQGVGAVTRTSQAKLRERVSVFDYMTPTQIADVQADALTMDLTTAIQTAIDSIGGNGGALYFPAGSYYISGELNITTRVNLIGDGRASELSFTHADSRLNISGTIAAPLESNVLSNLLIVGISTVSVGATPASASVINLNWLKFTKIENCFFYHTNINTDHMAWWSIDHCEFFDVEFNNNYTRALGEPNEISAGPKIDNCFMSVCQMTNTDTVDCQVNNSHWFGGNVGIKQRLVNFVGSMGDITAVPLMVTNSFFDSIGGHCLDIYDGYGVMLSNSWFSGGRAYGVDGVSIYRSSRVTITGCTFLYCGNTNPTSGLTIDNCDHVSIVGGTFSNNYTYGIKLFESHNVSIVGATFSNDPHIYGGYHIQPNGIIDSSGACTYITVIGCQFDPTLTTDLYAPDITNMYMGNQGFDLNHIGASTRTSVTTVDALPTALSEGAGARRMVSDANATTFASIVAGGGANQVPIYSNGTNWLIG